MNVNKLNRDESIIQAIILGLFILLFTSFNNTTSSNTEYTDNQYSSIEICENNMNAIQAVQTTLPDFNILSIISDVSFLNINTNIKFNEFSLTNKIKTEFHFLIYRYLIIKPITSYQSVIEKSYIPDNSDLPLIS